MAEQSRLYRTHAVVIRRRDHAEADRILTLFTPEHGRVEVVARGIRKPTSRKAGHLEPFTHTRLLLATSRTWDIVTEVETVESFRHLREDLDAISRAGYISEIIDIFAEADDDHRPLWELLLFTLRQLDHAAEGSADIDRNVLIDWYLLRLLGSTGFQPQLFHCLACNEAVQPLTNFFSMAEGGIYCPQCAGQRAGIEPVDPDLLKILRYLQSRPWHEAHRLHVPPPLMRRVDNLLHRYLLSILEQKVRSVDFLRRMQMDPRVKDNNNQE